MSLGHLLYFGCADVVCLLIGPTFGFGRSRLEEELHRRMQNPIDSPHFSFENCSSRQVITA